MNSVLTTKSSYPTKKSINYDRVRGNSDSVDLSRDDNESPLRLLKPRSSLRCTLENLKTLH